MNSRIRRIRHTVTDPSTSHTQAYKCCGYAPTHMHAVHMCPRMCEQHSYIRNLFTQLYCFILASHIFVYYTNICTYIYILFSMTIFFSLLSFLFFRASLYLHFAIITIYTKMCTHTPEPGDKQMQKTAHIFVEASKSEVKEKQKRRNKNENEKINEYLPLPPLPNSMTYDNTTVKWVNTETCTTHSPLAHSIKYFAVVKTSETTELSFFFYSSSFLCVFGAAFTDLSHFRRLFTRSALFRCLCLFLSFPSSSAFIFNSFSFFVHIHKYRQL